MLQNLDTINILPVRIIAWAGMETVHDSQDSLYCREYPHGKHMWDLTYVQQGVSRWVYRDGELLSSPGDVILLRPGTPKFEYEMRSPSGLRQFWTQFIPPPDWEQWLQWPEVSPGMMRLHLPPFSKAPESRLRRRVERAFRRVQKLADTPSPRWEELALTALKEALLWIDTINPQRTRIRCDPRLEKAIRHMTANMHKTIYLHDLAHISGSGNTTLGILFRRHFGIPPLHYLEQMRIARSLELLKDPNLQIQEVAAMVGYKTAAHFTRRFQELNRISPTGYRNRLLENRRKGKTNDKHE